MRSHEPPLPPFPEFSSTPIIQKAFEEVAGTYALAVVQQERERAAAMVASATLLNDWDQSQLAEAIRETGMRPKKTLQVVTRKALRATQETLRRNAVTDIPANIPQNRAPSEVG